MGRKALHRFHSPDHRRSQTDGQQGNSRLGWTGTGCEKHIWERLQELYTNPTLLEANISGHSTLSAAAAEILKRFAGSDHFGASFTAQPGSSLVEPGLTSSVPVTLSWETFSEAANQAGMSSRYRGIHFEKEIWLGAHWDVVSVPRCGARP